MSDLVLSFLISAAIVVALLLWAYTCHHLHLHSPKPDEKPYRQLTREELIAKYTRAA